MKVVLNHILSFDEIYTEYFFKLYSFAKKYIPQQEIAEDVVANVFVKLYKKREELADVKNLDKFLLKTIKNACIDYNRAQNNINKRHQAYLFSQKNIEEDSFPSSKQKIIEFILLEIENLPRVQKEICKLSFLEGLSNEEIEKKLNINNQSVRNMKTIAIKKLRDKALNALKT